MQALLFSLEGTIAYAALYVLLGWMSSKVEHHYYEVARRPELATPVNTANRWLLKFALLYALLGWIARVAATANFTVRSWPWPLAFCGHMAALLVACILILVIVWIAYLMHVEFTGIPPESLVAISMCGYAAFVMQPWAHWPWRWLPGLHN